MTTTVYLDVLFLINLYITYILLKASFSLLSIKIKGKRLFFASLIGGLFSLAILLEMSFVELLALRLLMGLSLVFVSLGKKPFPLFLKASACFYIVNFIFGGFIVLIITFAPINSLSFKNGALYFDVSALTLLISTTLAYFIVSAVSFILNSRNRRSETTEVKISLNGRETSVTALLDTGNKLIDLFSGLPVMVCEKSCLFGMLPKEILADLDLTKFPELSKKLGFRLIPVQTVGGKSVLPAIKCDSIELCGESRQAVIAITDRPLSDGSFNAVLNTNLL